MRLTNTECKEIQDLSLGVRGGSFPDHDGLDADPENSIKPLESFPSLALHSAHHKPTMECYGKSIRDFPSNIKDQVNHCEVS